MLDWVCEVTGASSARRGEALQELWSGYGEIVRIALEGGPVDNVIVKSVAPPPRPRHARGWATRRSHERKLRSYAVEAAWYRGPAGRCADGPRLPACFGVEARGEGWLFALEDLDAAGYPGRQYGLSHEEVDRCLEWLASFHARFMGQAPTGLWEEGTYWHLATRPDELEVMEPGPLRDAAGAIDRALGSCTHRTLVHGDAKVANFCFAGDGRVAAVDFQYVGGGCGMKDVAYLLSCLGSRTCERHAADYLDRYFEHLRRALGSFDRSFDAAAIEEEWRGLYPFAWADFERFLAGWAPDHRKRGGYAREMARLALERAST